MLRHRGQCRRGKRSGEKRNKNAPWRGLGKCEPVALRCNRACRRFRTHGKSAGITWKAHTIVERRRSIDYLHGQRRRCRLPAGSRAVLVFSDARTCLHVNERALEVSFLVPATQVEGLDAVESLRPVGSCAGGADRTKLHVLAISEADLTCAVGASVSPGNE